MHSQLADIFEMRNALLKRSNLNYYKTNEQIIRNSSLAAQDFYFSGDLAEYGACSLYDLSHDALYASLHAEYNIPYNSKDSRCVNCGLVLDLARALKADIESGILGRVGEIIAPELLEKSLVLQTYHNSDESGIPLAALRRMSPNARRAFLRLYCKRNGR